MYACHYFAILDKSRGVFSLPLSLSLQSDPCALFCYSQLCLNCEWNLTCILFQRTIVIKLILNDSEPVSGTVEEELATLSDWKSNRSWIPCVTDQWYFLGKRRRSMDVIPEMGFGTTWYIQSYCRCSTVTWRWKITIQKQDLIIMFTLNMNERNLMAVALILTSSH